MSSLRVGVLVCVFACLALSLVLLRAEQARCAARTLRLESAWVAKRRALWQLQVSIARLRSPEHVRDHLVWFDTGLISPGHDPFPDRSVWVAQKMRE